MIIGLASIYRVKQGGHSLPYPNITRLQIVFLLYNYVTKHQRKAWKVLIDTIPHTLTGSDRDNAAFYNQQDIDKSGLKIDLWLRIMLVKQAYNIDIKQAKISYLNYGALIGRT
jgi:hypothetical protein